MYIKEDGCYILNRTERERKHGLNISVTSEDIENVMVAALEGGINDWAVLDNTAPEWAAKPEGMPVSQYAAQLLLEGKTIIFYAAEDEAVWCLDLNKLLSGIRLCAVKQSWDFDFGEVDSISADCIFQYGMFGDIVYS